MYQPYILFAEDDAELSNLVAGRLQSAGYAIETVDNGAAALDAAARRTPDLVLLDLMLPQIDGLEVCRRLRAQYPLLYIIMLTARAEEIDRVVGLEVGADDYVTKPFSMQELLARVRAALRRLRLTEEQTQTADGEDAPMVFGDLEILPMRREARRRGEQVHLTAREFDLLLFLARHADRPFTRMQLLEQVWNISYEGYDRTVDSHVQRLRAKIEDDPGNPRYVRTVWGVGYKLQSHANE
jgi:DNA-binding response OmpR family regulator